MSSTVEDTVNGAGEPEAAALVASRERVRRVEVNGIEIAYETFGDPGDPAMVLVMGLGTQMIAWPEPMCEALAAAGLHVIRYDNRDIGLSTHVDAPPPSLVEMVVRRRPPYSIADMADDGLGLVDALGIDRFHLVGVSMGGFITQTMAIAQPRRVLTLTQMMTSTGSRKVGKPAMRVLRAMSKVRPVSSRQAFIDDAVRTYEIVGSAGHLDPDEVRRLAGESFDRCFDPGGRERQLAAIVAQPDRTSDLRRLDLPTLVFHGLGDPLVSASGGLAIARAVPGARFVGYQGMGHDLPRTMWRPMTEEILDLVGLAVPA